MKIIATYIKVAAEIFDVIMFLAGCLIVLMFVDLELMGRECSAWE